MIYSNREQAVLKLFEYSELWGPLGFDSCEEALAEMCYDEIEALMEQESHNLEEDIKEILDERSMPSS